MTTLINNLKLFWFQPLPPARLAILRISSGCLSLWYLVARYDMLMRFPANSRSMYEPVGLMQFGTEPFSAVTFSILLWATIGFNILYILGWKFRYTGPVFAVLLLVFFSYRNSWSMIYHNYNLLVLHIFIIGFAASGDALSVTGKQNKSPGIKPVAHWQYGWPVKLICLITALSYFISGIAKLTGDLAWDWLSGQAMRSQVAVDSLRKNVMGEETSPVFDLLYTHTWFFFFVGIATMVVELGAPFILHKKRLILTWVLLAFMMHWGIFFIMGIKFYHHMTGIIFLPFLEPEKWLAYFRQKFSGERQSSSTGTLNKEPAIVLFDGECNFCDSTVQFIINRDPEGQFHFVSLQSEKGKTMLGRHHLPNDLSTIALIKDGMAYTKSTAMLNIFRQLDSGWKYLYAFIIIPAPIRNTIYKIIAKNRYSWFGQKTDCQIPSIEIRKRFYS